MTPNTDIALRMFLEALTKLVDKGTELIQMAIDEEKDDD